MCDGLFKEYPMGDLTPEELVKKHFPNVISRSMDSVSDSTVRTEE